MGLALNITLPAGTAPNASSEASVIVSLLQTAANELGGGKTSGGLSWNAQQVGTYSYVATAQTGLMSATAATNAPAEPEADTSQMPPAARRR